MMKWLKKLFKCRDCSIFINDNLRLRREKAALRKELEQALKNDHRDERGRFKKG